MATIKGKYYGGNAWTANGRATINGFVGAVGTQPATELLIKGGLALTWQGCATIAIGGCMANLAVAGLGG